MSGIVGSYHRRNTGRSVEWYTRRWIFDEIGLPFDLDPASPLDAQTAVPARRRLTVREDGLSASWEGRVWLNPPYGPETGRWMARMNAHGNGVALVFSRTDTGWFHEALRHATAGLLLRGRIDFIPGEGSGRQNARSRSGAGSMFFAYGETCAQALHRLAHRGYYFHCGAAAAADAKAERPDAV